MLSAVETRILYYWKGWKERGEEKRQEMKVETEQKLWLVWLVMCMQVKVPKTGNPSVYHRRAQEHRPGYELGEICILLQLCS